MMHQHGAHASPPAPRPQSGALPGWTGEPTPMVQTAHAWRQDVRPRRAPFRFAIALATLCALLGIALAALDAIPTGEAHRVAVRTVTR